MNNLFQILMRSKTYFLLWLLTLLSFFTCYYSTFLWLNNKYLAQDSYYSHGYLIPIISAYLIYLKKNELNRIPLSSNYTGLGIIIATLIFHILGVVGDINFISGFSMVLYILGCSIYLLGINFTKKIIFPILFLIFMCPIPDEIINLIALPLKSMATSLALSIINLIGIPFTQEGFKIHLPLATFIVGTPCNGMRSLIAFLALGILSLSFIRTSVFKKVMFIALIPPISILLNGLRIAMLLGIAYKFGQEAASPESYLHDGSGLMVFILGLIALMISYRFINNER